MDFNKLFARLAGGVAHAAGTPIAFVLCLAAIAAWGLSGPMFRFSDTWQLVINTGTTIVTFLMVFLIQNTQNRDGAAIQIKLDELILTSKAENEFIGIEKLTDKELAMLHDRCADAAKRSQSLAEKAGAEIAARRGRSGGDAKAAPKPAAQKPRSPPRRKTAKQSA